MGICCLNQQPFPEPTCYSLLALDGTSFSASETLSWLAGLVQENGQLLLPGDDMPNWATSLLIITLIRLDQLPEVRTSSINWLLEWKSRTGQDTDFTRLNPSLVGWPWISDTFSWVHPTGYGALALKLSGLKTHQRVKEAEIFIAGQNVPAGRLELWQPRRPGLGITSRSGRYSDSAVRLAGFAGSH